MMPFTINNLSSRPVIVSLNSGEHLRLSPGEISGEIRDVEMKDNAKIDKLKQQRVIAVERQGDAAADDSGHAAGETADDGGERKEEPGQHG
jgi:hypothetical protein